MFKNLTNILTPQTKIMGENKTKDIYWFISLDFATYNLKENRKNGEC
jgi:hypothetical protein